VQVDLHVKCWLLFDSNQNWDGSANFNITQYQISENRLWFSSCLFYVDRHIFTTFRCEQAKNVSVQRKLEEVFLDTVQSK
jgi:hypothetical protein